MKRTRAQYEGEEKTERLLVNQAALCSLMQFYDSDQTVHACQNNIDTSVFDGSYVFSIGDAASAKRPSFFNTPSYLHAVRLVQTRARAHVRAIGGFAYWTVKNLARWLQLYANTTNDHERHDLGLPYGVLEVWEYALELEQQTVGHHYAFRVLPHSAREDCHYFFYSHDMSLLPLDETKMATYERRGAHFLNVAQQLGSGNNVSHQGYAIVQQRVPQSPFYHLADARDELEQVKLNLLDADWLRTHPKAILRTAASSSEADPNVSDGDLFTGGSMMESTMKARRRQAQMSLQQMADLINSVRQAEGVQGKSDAPRQRQRRYYRYSDMLDDAELWDEMVELVHWAEPAVLNDFTRRFEEYKFGVLTAMGLSETSRFAQALLGKVAREASGLGGRSHIGMLVDRDERNQHTESEQRIHVRIFEVVHGMCGFSRHDAFAVSELVETLDTLITEEEIRRTAVRNLARLQQTAVPTAPAAAAKHMLRVEDGDEKKSKKTKKKQEDEGDVILSKLRVKVADMRAWLAQTAHRPEKISLIFENTENDMIKLQFYQEMRTAGLVSVKELERQARKVYDTDTHLQEPPTHTGEGK